MDWIVNNWETIFAVIGIIGTICTAFVELFSGRKLGKVFSIAVKICDLFSVVNTKENKEKIANASKKKSK